MRSKWFAAALVALVMLAGAGPASALDPRFKDENGDLVADPPADPKQFVDPSVLIFAYTPVEDPSVYARIWDGFLKHLQTVTGKRVQFFPVQSNAAQIEAMRAGRLHIAGYNTGALPIAVNCSGFVPFAMMAAKNGSFGYEMEIITYPGSGVEKVEDLRGKKLAFTAETSNSGYKAPAAILRDKFGMEAGRDYQPVFSGKHDNSILGVANKDFHAAAIAGNVRRRMEGRKMVRPEQTKVIYTSDTFPSTGYGHIYNLKPELAAKVREAFFNFPWEGSDLGKEFAKSEPPGEKFIPITYQKHWEVVRAVDTSMGVKYVCK